MPRVPFSLYLVTDRHQTAGRPLLPLVAEAFGAGLAAVQLREKDLATRALLALAREITTLAAARSGFAFVNDRLDVALAVGASGVHLRSDSLPVGVARRLLGPAPLLGVSAHSIDEVRRADAEGADFVVLGPVYDTPSKRAYGSPLGLRVLAEAARSCRIPIFAIGGVTRERVRELLEAGAHGVAVVSAILASESVAAATHALLDALGEQSRPSEKDLQPRQ